MVIFHFQTCKCHLCTQLDVGDLSRTSPIISIEKTCCRNVFVKAKARQKMHRKKWRAWVKCRGDNKSVVKESSHAMHTCTLHGTVRFHTEFTLLLLFMKGGLILTDFVDENLMKRGHFCMEFVDAKTKIS